MGRAPIRLVVRSRSGAVLTGASVVVFERDTSVPIDDLFLLEEGGSALDGAALISDSDGLVTGWLGEARSVDAFISGGLVNNRSVGYAPIRRPIEVHQTPEDDAADEAAIDGAASAAIAAETAARAAGDDALADALDAEALARASGDSANATAIAAEATTRASADSTLTTNVAANAAAIGAEATARVSGDSANATAIAAETTRATTAEGGKLATAGHTSDSIPAAAGSTSLADLAVPASTVVGRKATGPVAALTGAELAGLIPGGTYAGVETPGVPMVAAGITEVRARGVLANLSSSAPSSVNRTALLAKAAEAASGGVALFLPPGTFNIDPTVLHAWNGMRVDGANAGTGYDAGQVTTRLVNPGAGVALTVDVGTGDTTKRWQVQLANFEVVGNASSGDNLVVGELSNGILGPVTIENVVTRLSGGKGLRCQGKIDQLKLSQVVARDNADGILVDGSGTNGFISETVMESLHSSWNTGTGYQFTGDYGNVVMLGCEGSTESVGIDLGSAGRSLTAIGHHSENISLYPWKLQNGDATLIVLGGSHTDNSASGIVNVFFCYGINVRRARIEGFTAYMKNNPSVLVRESTGSKVYQQNNRIFAITGSPALYYRRAADTTLVDIENGGPTSTRWPSSALVKGDQFFDTDLGVPISWDGSAWASLTGGVGPTGPAGPGSYGVPRTVDPLLVPPSGAAIGAANRVRWFRVRDSGTISKITINLISGTAGNMHAAVYRNTGSGRNARPDGAPLGTSANVSTNVASGNIDITLGSSVVVADGDWFAIQVDNNTATFSRLVGISIDGFSYSYDAASFTFPTIASGVPFLTVSGQLFGLWGG